MEEDEELTKEAFCPPLPATPHTRVATILGRQNANRAAPGTEVELQCEPGYRDPRFPCQVSVLRCIHSTWHAVQGDIPKCCTYLQADERLVCALFEI